MPFEFTIEDKSDFPSSRSDWDAAFEAAMSLEPGKVLRLVIPEGMGVEVFRGRVVAMFFNRVKRAKDKPQVRFRSWITEDDDAVIVEKLDLSSDDAVVPGGG